MKWYLMAWQKYFQFSGRSRRKEFWMFVLFNIIAGIILQILDDILGTKYGATTPIITGEAFMDSMNIYLSQGTGILGTIYSLAVIIPNLALAVRRLHDVNRSGLWLLAIIIPSVISIASVFLALLAPMIGGLIAMVCGLSILVLAILLLVWYCTEGTAGPNKYGEDPKGNNNLSEFGGVFEDRTN